jgi:hypothetical protein
MGKSMQRSRAGSLWWKCSAILGVLFGSIAFFVSALELFGGKGPVANEVLYLAAGGLLIEAGLAKYNNRDPGLPGSSVP